MPKTLLDELEEIDLALTEGEATPKQEKRGQELVHLANAAPALLAAFGLIADFEAYVNNEEDVEIRERNQAWIKQARAAVAEASGVEAFRFPVRLDGFRCRRKTIQMPNLIYMPEETAPTVATEGNRKAVAYLELSDDDDDHDYYGHLFVASPRLLAGLNELLLQVEEWIAEEFVCPYDEDAGETAESFLSPYWKLLAQARGGAA
jgi:hypothetical protein